MKRLFLAVCVLLFSQIHGATTYGQFSSLMTQLPGPGNSVVKLDSIDTMKNLSVTPLKDKIIIKEDGVYFFIASGQAGATKDPAKGYIDLWFNKNDQLLPNSNARFSVRDAFDTGVLITQFVLVLQAGDTISVGFSATAPNLGLIYSSPPKEPAIVSFFLSVFKMETL